MPHSGHGTFDAIPILLYPHARHLFCLRRKYLQRATGVKIRAHHDADASAVFTRNPGHAMRVGSVSGSKGNGLLTVIAKGPSMTWTLLRGTGVVPLPCGVSV